MFLRLRDRTTPARREHATLPICLAMPGVLPVINRQAVEYTLLTALALNADIPR